MKTIEQAKIIQKNMGAGYNIYFDKQYNCYRVMSPWSPSLERWVEDYTLVN